MCITRIANILNMHIYLKEKRLKEITFSNEIRSFISQFRPTAVERLTQAASHMDLQKTMKHKKITKSDYTFLRDLP